MPPKQKKGRNPLTTLAVVASCLVLGAPVGGVAVDLESTFMPAVPLKDPSVILQAPHIALYAGAFTSIASGVFVALTYVMHRHIALNNAVVAIAGFGMAILNQAAQLVALGLVYIFNATHPESKSINEIRFINNEFDTGGKQFTRETFSCMMGNLYLGQNPWATTACSEYHYARYCTILMSVMGFLLLGIAYWPVRKSLFGSQDRPTVDTGGKA